MKCFYKQGTVFERDPQFYEQPLTNRRSHSLTSDINKQKHSRQTHDKTEHKINKHDAISILSQLRWPSKYENRDNQTSKLKRSRIGLSLGRGGAMSFSGDRSDRMEKINPHAEEKEIEALRQENKELRENVKKLFIDKHSIKLSELSKQSKHLEDLQKEYLKNSVKIAEFESTRSEIEHRLHNIIRTDLRISEILSLGFKKRSSNDEIEKKNILTAVRQALCRGEDRETVRILLSNFWR